MSNLAVEQSSIGVETACGAPYLYLSPGEEGFCAATLPRSRKPRRSRELSAGNRVLLVEDESLVAMMMGEVLTELGFSVIGPCATAAEATATIGSTDVSAAILDVNLDGELVYPVADLLAARDIPFAFITGYGEESLSPRYADVPVLQKPIDRKALQDLFVVGRGASSGC